MTNLLLQDATFGRTPRQRGITLLHEAQAAGVATLLGCDNVQDAFCPAGSYDPLDTLACGLFSAQLSDLFDRQSRLNLRSRGANRFAGRRGALCRRGGGQRGDFPG
ncbi:putative cytosine deaminase [Klebsiella pneumoniae]|uniref:Putative cytosine deaminase n=1 Tax=Klebsiella pneumoniae TaxID=573 RepID=A0A377TXB0_KLEPN|nr:putative cytosine deaminase [Klebsiella pneumoniae]